MFYKELGLDYYILFWILIIGSFILFCEKFEKYFISLKVGL